MIPNKVIEVDGARLKALVGEPETAEVRYVRAFARPDRPRSFDALCELISEATNLTDEDVDSMTMAEVQTVFGQVVEAINKQAVNPPKGDASSPTEPEPPSTSPPGGATP